MIDDATRVMLLLAGEESICKTCNNGIERLGLTYWQPLVPGSDRRRKAIVRVTSRGRAILADLMHCTICHADVSHNHAKKSCRLIRPKVVLAKCVCGAVALVEINHRLRFRNGTVPTNEHARMCSSLKPWSRP